MTHGSRIVNHTRKLKNAPKLLQHEHATFVHQFSNDAHPFTLKKCAILKIQHHGRDSPALVERLSKSATRSNVLPSSIFQRNSSSMTTKEGNPVAQAIFRKEFSCSQLHLRRGFSSDAGLPPHREIGMPSLSPTMAEGTIAKWMKKEGDTVSPGEVLCEVETDKATVEMENMEEGYLAKIIRGDGSKEIKVGEVIAIIVEDEEDVAKFKNYYPSATDSSHSAVEVPPAPTPPKEEIVHEVSISSPETKISKPSAAPRDNRIIASPLSRVMAKEHNVPLSSIKGTGLVGSIVKADIEDYLASSHVKQVSATAPKARDKMFTPLDYTDIPHSQIKQVTASRLLLSKQTTPHFYLTVDTCVDKLMDLGSQLNSLQEASSGKRVSVNDLVIKAAALALQKVPQCNSSWTDNYIRQYHNVNINVAVQTDNGLFVPVIRAADKKGLSKIGNEVKHLAQKAKENRLKPEDYEGGTFTVSNLGGLYGIKQFCAIINPPQSSILAVGYAEKRVVLSSDTGDDYKFASFMSVTLSCDHRVIDGAIGAEWLKSFKGYIENPESMLL